MGDLALDTHVEPLGDGRYRAQISPDWKIWGPNGGYVASIALRAAGAATGRARPATLVAQFLGVADHDAVEANVEILRTARFATAARVSLRQGDRLILEALTWGVDPGDMMLEHDISPAPEVPGPEDVPSRADRIAALPPGDPGPPHLPFFDNLEQHPLQWRDSWPPEGPEEPVTRQWLRYRPTARFDDAWIDACRLLIPVDTFGWPAASQAHAWIDPPEAVAVTVDLKVSFHRPTAQEWLLVEAVSPIATGGLATADAQVWDRAGRLVASGCQTMLCRPAFYAGG
jgi:acyl-CoA thioesterase-2